MSLASRIEQLQQEALDSLTAASDEASLEEWRVRYLGRRGELAALMGELGRLSPEEKPVAGQAANAAKSSLQAAYDAALSERRQGTAQAALGVDVTMPGTPPTVGGLHLTRQTLYEMVRILAPMGFTVYETNEVETDEYNFQLLNLPPHHPARDMHDTMYISGDILLRTHTSPGQIRAMREFAPEPIRLLLPGKCHRYEAIDATHESMFYQIEGLAVGSEITLATLKGLFKSLAEQFFGGRRQVRFRGSYFPFTEPSVEIDISCTCGGAGCPICKGTGWLEISGGGMVHPVVLENGGYDPSTVSGFAFGMGIERPAILNHGIDDIRHFYGNDLRFLQQFT